MPESSVVSSLVISSIAHERGFFKLAFALSSLVKCGTLGSVSNDPLPERIVFVLAFLLAVAFAWLTVSGLSRLWQ